MKQLFGVFLGGFIFLFTDDVEYIKVSAIVFGFNHQCKIRHWFHSSQMIYGEQNILVVRIGFRNRVFIFCFHQLVCVFLRDERGNGA
ncbi:hypothetical protein SDC9_190425 [bioreactor metagenome]|uniref:Uncharacterized protein n=1 Tax=bioreactor metagenome TaxID=1076179 RepID=A0A645HV56_9ZZZZ